MRMRKILNSLEKNIIFSTFWLLLCIGFLIMHSLTGYSVLHSLTLIYTLIVIFHIISVKCCFKCLYDVSLFGCVKFPVSYNVIYGYIEFPVPYNVIPFNVIISILEVYPSKSRLRFNVYCIIVFLRLLLWLNSFSLKGLYLLICS